MFGNPHITPFRAPETRHPRVLQAIPDMPRARLSSVDAWDLQNNHPANGFPMEAVIDRMIVEMRLWGRYNLLSIH